LRGERLSEEERGLEMLTAYASLASDSRTALVGLMRTLQKVG
jgi:hypothetical protein